MPSFAVFGGLMTRKNSEGGKRLAGSVALLALVVTAPFDVQAQSRTQAAYDQLCGAGGTASAATCAALSKELAGELRGSSPPAGARRDSESGDPSSILFQRLSQPGYFWISPEEVAYVLTFDWDAAKREVKFTMLLPGVGAPDTHTLAIASSGSLAGLRNASGLKLKVNGRVRAADSFEIDPYKLGWGAGSIRQRYTLLQNGELSVFSEQLKDGQWCCSDNVMAYKPISREALAELMPRLTEMGRTFTTAYNQRADAEKRQKRQERAELFGQLMQGALIAGQAYAAGVQEAAAANGRSQAIINDAAVADQRYQASQRAPDATRLGGSRSQTSSQQAQASTSRPVQTAAPTARQPAGSASSAGHGATSIGSGGNAAGPALENRTVRAYFVTGMEPTPSDTRNPLCYSNIITVTFPWDPHGWGNAGRGADATARYAPIFREKCARLGKVDVGMPAANIEGVTSGWPYPPSHPTDRRVTLP